MPYIYIIMGLIICGYTYVTQTTINHLKADNELLIADMHKVVEINKGFETVIADLNTNYANGLKALDAIKREKQKEVHYVTTIKEQIKQDTNATCIDAINAIYKRMHELSTSSSKAATIPQKRPNGGDSDPTGDELGQSGK